MSKHQHCSCGHDRPSNKLQELISRWVIVLFTVTMCFIFMKPFVINHMLGRVSSYISGQMYGDAVRICKKAVLIDPTNSVVWEQLGYVYESQRDFNQAIRAYDHAVQFDPHNRSAQLSLGLLLVSQKKYAEAAEHFEMMRSLGADHMQKTLINYYHAALKMLLVCYDALKDEHRKELILQELQAPIELKK
jgi:tetratricopeptide (TPR) repeat protein